MCSPSLDFSRGTARSVELSSALYSPDTPRETILRSEYRVSCISEVPGLASRSAVHESQATSIPIRSFDQDLSLLNCSQSDVDQTDFSQSIEYTHHFHSCCSNDAAVPDSNRCRIRPVSGRSRLYWELEPELGERPECEGAEDPPEGRDINSGSYRRRDKLIDSDTSCFMNAPLCGRGVTGSRPRTSNKYVIGKLKRFKRQICNLKRKSDCLMKTLAII